MTCRFTPERDRSRDKVLTRGVWRGQRLSVGRGVITLVHVVASSGGESRRNGIPTPHALRLCVRATAPGVGRQRGNRPCQPRGGRREGRYYLDCCGAADHRGRGRIGARAEGVGVPGSKKVMAGGKYERGLTPTHPIFDQNRSVAFNLLHNQHFGAARRIGCKDPIATPTPPGLRLLIRLGGSLIAPILNCYDGVFQCLPRLHKYGGTASCRPVPRIVAAGR